MAKSKAKERLGSIDTEDLGGLLAIFVGMLFATASVSTIWSYDLSSALFSVGPASVTGGLALGLVGMGVIVGTNEVGKEDLLDYGVDAGVAFMLFGATGILLALDPTFVQDYLTGSAPSVPAQVVVTVGSTIMGAVVATY